MPQVKRTTINTDYKYWPWDEQKCNIIIGSWTKTGEELDVVNMGGRNRTSVRLTNYTPTIWDIKSAYADRQKKTYGSVSASWPDVTITLILKRQSYVDQKIAVLPIIRRT